VARPATGAVLVRKTKGGRSYSIRVTAYGKRHQVRLGTSGEGWTHAKAEEELQNVLADVRREQWTPPTRHVVEAPTEIPTFHLFASEWVERHRREVAERTVEFWTGHLTNNLLPFFADYRLDEITAELVDRYKVAKLREREAWEALTDRERYEARRRHVARPGLGPTSINKSLALLARIMDEAIEYGHVSTANPAKGKRRRLRAPKPTRTWLEPNEAAAVLDAAGDKYRPILAVMMLGGLRVSEAIGLRWRDLDLAKGTLRVERSKTDAGRREVDLSPMLREALVVHRANSAHFEPDDLVFATANGTPYQRNNVRRRGVGKAVERANAALVEAGMAPIADGITNHSLRRTFASLLYEAGASPAYVMAQMGHTSSALALEVYAKKMARSRDTGERMDELLRGADWGGETAEVSARFGANGHSEAATFSSEETKVRD
jgi:integrase